MVEFNVDALRARPASELDRLKKECRLRTLRTLAAEERRMPGIPPLLDHGVHGSSGGGNAAIRPLIQKVGAFVFTMFVA